MSKSKAKPKRGRPFAAKGRVATERSICWLVPSDKVRLQAHAQESHVSESLLLRRGLVATGVLEHQSV